MGAWRLHSFRHLVTLRRLTSMANYMDWDALGKFKVKCESQGK